MSSSLDRALRLNRHFSQGYAQAKAKAVSRALMASNPTIIRLESALVLLRSGTRERAEILGDDYHAYKSVAHVPATLTLALTQPTPPPTPQLESLLEDLRVLLDSSALDSRLRAAAAPCMSLVEAWLEARHTTQDAAPPDERVAKFKLEAQRAIGPCMVAAARAELAQLHEVVSAWTKAFNQDDWRSLKVVICASHQARYRESTKLYFTRLLADALGRKQRSTTHAADEHQVIYAENCNTEDDALNLLAMHHVDRDLASWLLGDESSLQKDVIGDTFARLLDELFD
ncbi:MAG: hypothetical protein KC492_28760 [Myxococcales bacterium]|nr:hypothetical protein [Myxococcales bacterium]